MQITQGGVTLELTQEEFRLLLGVLGKSSHFDREDICKGWGILGRTMYDDMVAMLEGRD
jgi:hypothetical protein